MEVQRMSQKARGVRYLQLCKALDNDRLNEVDIHRRDMLGCEFGDNVFKACHPIAIFNDIVNEIRAQEAQKKLLSPEKKADIEDEIHRLNLLSLEK